MLDFSKMYIDGAWVDPIGDGTSEIINAATEEVMGSVPQGNAQDVDAAVAAAKTAFETWSQTTPSERQDWLNKLHAGLVERSDDIAEAVSGEVGMPISLSGFIQAGLPASNMASFASLLDTFDFEEELGNSLILREPVGVVGAISPWNYPLHQIMCKVGGALAAGCTIVVKPSGEAPLNAFIFAEIVDSVGLPAGVFNLVSGPGSVIGEALASHPDVDMISLTGSARAGKSVAASASKTLKRVALELGGKSPNIILDDADFEDVIPKGLGNFFINTGQTCTAQSRLLVPNSRYDEAVEIAKTVVENVQIGQPFDQGNHMGPLISQAQWDTVQGYIRDGIDEGAVVAAGGLGKPEGFETGYFCKPTLFVNVTNDMKVAQEEIFGPVLVVIGYEDDDDAIRIANDSPYGLSGGIWSGDKDRAIAVSKKIRTGMMIVNGGAFNLQAPFGGYKESGYGRENGPYGIDEFLEIKSLQL